MLYHLFQALKDYDIPGQGLMGYLSFRAILANVISMLFAFFAGEPIIRWLQRRQIGETIRDLGLEGQMQKKGTPTMGGVIFITAILAGVLLVADLTNIYTQLLLLTTVWCGGVGFADDYIKVFKHNKEGLSERMKMLLLFGLAFAIALIVCVSPSIPTDNLVTTIPFFKANEFDYSWLSPFKGQLGVYCTWGIYLILIIFVILACSNGTNLTDGMDGLAAGTSAIVGVVIGVLAWLGGNVLNADYLNIMFIPGSGEVAVFMAAFVGALVGFLWYNCYPAQVFMGDTGSLTLGGIIGECSSIDLEIKQCRNDGSITGTYGTGGIAGILTNAKILKCANRGYVYSSDKRVGGITGYLSEGTVEDSYNWAAVYGDKYVGGIAGFVSSDCFFTRTGNR